VNARQERLLHAMWVGPAGTLLCMSACLFPRTIQWPTWPVAVIFLGAGGATLVIAAAIISGSEGFKQLQERPMKDDQ
jgi:hypothetical protein